MSSVYNTVPDLDPWLTYTNIPGTKDMKACENWDYKHQQVINHLTKQLGLHSWLTEASHPLVLTLVLRHSGTPKIPKNTCKSVYVYG
jgi:hypothetical protein